MKNNQKHFCYVCTPVSKWPDNADEQISLHACPECEELLSNNSGYNPEDLDDIANYDPDDSCYHTPEELKSIIESLTLTECTSIKEYIKEFKGVNGYIYQEKLWTRD